MDGLAYNMETGQAKFSVKGHSLFRAQEIFAIRNYCIPEIDKLVEKGSEIWRCMLKEANYETRICNLLRTAFYVRLKQENLQIECVEEVNPQEYVELPRADVFLRKYRQRDEELFGVFVVKAHGPRVRSFMYGILFAYKGYGAIFKSFDAEIDFWMMNAAIMEANHRANMINITTPIEHQFMALMTDLEVRSVMGSAAHIKLRQIFNYDKYITELIDMPNFARLLEVHLKSGLFRVLRMEEKLYVGLRGTNDNNVYEVLAVNQNNRSQSVWAIIEVTTTTAEILIKRPYRETIQMWYVPRHVIPKYVTKNFHDTI